MNESGSLCPAVKAADMIGDKWILLILREMLLGAKRYNEFQRALPRISPTVLSKRLKQLEAGGLIVKKSAPGQKSSEYRLTRCGRELGPIVDQLSRWGLRWARRRLKEEDFDVGAFMWDFHRSLNTEELPDGETVLCVCFSELKHNKTWWILAEDKIVDLCTDDPGREVHVYLTSTLPCLAEVWMGDVDVSAAVKTGDIKLSGPPQLVRSIERWFPKSRYADVRPERILEQ